MTLRTVKKSVYLYHNDSDKRWEDKLEGILYVEDSIENLRDKYGISGGNRERVIEEIADSQDGEYVVWHDYNREFTQVMEVTA